MNTELLIPLLTFGGTLLLVVTGLLNFSVFVRQLRAAMEQLDTAAAVGERTPAASDPTGAAGDGGVSAEQLRLGDHSFSRIFRISGPSSKSAPHHFL